MRASTARGVAGRSAVGRGSLRADCRGLRPAPPAARSTRRAGPPWCVCAWRFGVRAGRQDKGVRSTRYRNTHRRARWPPPSLGFRCPRRGSASPVRPPRCGRAPRGAGLHPLRGCRSPRRRPGGRGPTSGGRGDGRRRASREAPALRPLRRPSGADHAGQEAGARARSAERSEGTLARRSRRGTRRWRGVTPGAGRHAPLCVSSGSGTEAPWCEDAGSHRCCG